MSTAMSATPSPVRSGQMYGAFLLPSSSGQGAPSGSVSSGTAPASESMTTGSDHVSPESVDHMAEILSPLRPCLLSLWIQSKTLINVLSVCPAVRA